VNVNDVQIQERLGSISPERVEQADTDARLYQAAINPRVNPSTYRLHFMSVPLAR